MATLILNKNQTLFVHVPKTGGTSISSWIENNFEFQKTDRIHCSLDEASNYFKKKYFSFAVVRNPWDRMVSYYYFIKRHTNDRLIHNTLNSVHKLKWKSYFKKIEYLKKRLSELNKGFYFFLENKNLWELGAISTQTQIVSGVDKILKFETLENDFTMIQERLYCFKPLPKLNLTNHEYYKNYYKHSKFIDIVAEHFKDDIKNYNYSW